MEVLHKHYPLDARHSGADRRDERRQVEDAAVKFEGMFIAHLLGEMRRINQQFAPAGGDAGRKEDSGLLDHAYRLVADDIAKQRAFGIADAIAAQMAPREVPAAAPHDAPRTHSNQHGSRA